MRHRGAVFWAWADPSLKHHFHEEILADGARLDVQVRLSRTADTQLFIRIYERSGLARIEEAYAKRPRETITRPIHRLRGTDLQSKCDFRFYPKYYVGACTTLVIA